MRVRLLLNLSLCAVALMPTAGSPAQDVVAAKSFLTSVYKNYHTDGIGVDTVGPHARLYFHSSLIALMREDQKAASPEVGAIDADPVCACQDWNGIWDLKIDVHLETPQRAKASVSFALDPPKDRPNDALRRLAVTLATDNGAWRIYDIVDVTDPKAPFGLRKALEQDINSYRHASAIRTK
jgi:hypothetical protein